MEPGLTCFGGRDDLKNSSRPATSLLRAAQSGRSVVRQRRMDAASSADTINHDNGAWETDSAFPFPRLQRRWDAHDKGVLGPASDVLSRISRRQFLLAASAAAAGGVAADGVVIDPLLTLLVTRYRLSPRVWPAGLTLSLAVIADIHACDPWLTVAHIEKIVDATNALEADAVVLLGDFVAGHTMVTAFVPDSDWARALSALRAPLGVYAVLGNHDWWADDRAQLLGRGPIAARTALERAGIPVLENDVVKLSRAGEEFWIAGLGDQYAFVGAGARGLEEMVGLDDLDAILDKVAGEAPIVLLAHEPDIFPRVPSRIGVTLAGHTHGGQVRPFGQILFAPSPMSRTYNYGHFCENGRHLIVSGGIGCSAWPVRLGAPPEVLLVTLGP